MTLQRDTDLRFDTVTVPPESQTVLHHVMAARDVTKIYGEGDTAVHALRDVTVDSRADSSPRSWDRPGRTSPP